jgi:hypothetical protein
MTLAAMTADRAYAILYPFKAKTICTVSQAKKVVITLTAVFAVVEVNVFFTYKLGFIMGRFEDIVMDFKSHPWVEVIVAVYHSAVMSFIPFSVIFVSNILILRSVRSAASDRSKLSQGERSGASGNRHLTRMLLLVSSAFIVCCLPFAVYEISFAIPAVYEMYDYNSTYGLLSISIIGWTNALFTQMNHGVNFYLYVLGGGRKFRTDAENALRMRCTVWQYMYKK